MKKALQRGRIWLFLSILALKQTPPYTHPHFYTLPDPSHTQSLLGTDLPPTLTYAKADASTDVFLWQHRVNTQTGDAEEQPALRQIPADTHTNPDSLPKEHRQAHTEIRSISTHRDTQIDPPPCHTPPSPVHADSYPGTRDRSHTQTLSLTHPVQVWEPVGSLCSSSWAQPAN